MVVLDGGNAFMAAHNNPTALTESQLDQRRLKADLIAESYQLVGLDAIALGDQDWILGTQWLQEMVACLKTS